MIIGTMLKDALHNLDGASGASDEYCKGLVVGVVATLMAAGMTYPRAIALVIRDMPDGVSPERLPEAFRSDFPAQ